MFLINYIRKYWNPLDSISQSTIIAALLLVVFAYFPTLEFDYVTQDQWRAFRYSLGADTAADRLLLCAKMLPNFYVQSGRPLVWITECLEHTVVANIADFILLRPIMLIVVLITTICLGIILSSVVSSIAISTIAAAAFVLMPGYSFMFLQGMPALMVLISIILSACSYKSLSKFIKLRKLKEIFKAFLYFFLACCIYPAYAFIVVVMALLAFGFNHEREIKTKFYKLLNILLFYFFSSLIYYAFVRLCVLILTDINAESPVPDVYEVLIKITPVFSKIQAAIRYFYHMPPFNFYTISGITFFIYVTFSVSPILILCKKNMTNIAATIPVLIIITPIILIASISPWLFSNMNQMATRHLLPWYLFYCFATVNFISLLFNQLSRQIARLTPIFVLLIFLLPLAIIQNRLSIMEVVVTGVEITTMRSKLHNWVANEGWINNRYILVVIPTVERPIGIDKYVNNSQFGNENAVFASSKNPVSISWMITGLLREQIKGNEFNLVYCDFEQSCVNYALQNPKNVVVGYFFDNKPINSPVQPYIINLSVLTDRPITPEIKIVPTLQITASSTFDNFGVDGLLYSLQPGWHAERDPKYPQFITVDFGQQKAISKISFLPQDGEDSRMPKDMILKKSTDGKSWHNFLQVTNICNAGIDQGWRNVALPVPIETQFFKIEILSNCGDPSILTLRGLRFE